ncbi:glycosyltransferase [Bacillus sp. DJP31]|uniref:glycosyltransferase n=1 Tax=Bacillus sp. DJP31 TaxID=3409789 RepID=UPI003BB4F545
MKLTAVLVLYQMKIEDCVTFQTLKKHLVDNSLGLGEVEVIIYDNSPVEQKVVTPLNNSGFVVSYVHDSKNLGIATAYNYALECARKNNSEWLLLLDHDTELTADYIHKIKRLDVEQSVVAVVPKINCNHVMISPVYSHSLRPLAEERPNVGIQTRPVMAINSGALIRVSFLNGINGFNEEFPLDYLDHWLFNEIYLRGQFVLVVDVSLEHELSVMDYNQVSLKRYQSILNSEFHYYKNYKKDLYKAFKQQLQKRLLKQVVLVKNKKIALYTLRRLFSA